MISFLRIFRRRSVNRLAVSVVAANLANACLSQQLPTYNWDQIRDLLDRSNPTLRAGEQGIVSSRAAEVTAGFRPNPTLQNDTTSGTLGIYQEF